MRRRNLWLGATGVVLVGVTVYLFWPSRVPPAIAAQLDVIRASPGSPEAEDAISQLLGYPSAAAHDADQFRPADTPKLQGR